MIEDEQILAIERWESMPTIPTMCQLAAVLHVKPEDLYEVHKEHRVRCDVATQHALFFTCD